MRDLLSELEANTFWPDLLASATHPSGVTSAPLSALTDTSASQEAISFWPDVVADLRAFSSTDIAAAPQGVATSTLDGQELVDARLPGQWWWFLVVTAGDSLPHAHYVIWRTHDDRCELVAVLPAGEPVTRAWQASPDPEATNKATNKAAEDDDDEPAPALTPALAAALARVDISFPRPTTEAVTGPAVASPHTRHGRRGPARDGLDR